MTSRSEEERPPVKRSKSDQVHDYPTINVTADAEESDSSALSATSRMEGHDGYDSDEDGSITSSMLEDVVDEAEDRPYQAEGVNV